MKKVLKTIGILIGALLLIALIYVAYVMFTYSRIEDHQNLSIGDGAAVTELSTGEEYTAVTQNCGFGAYTPEFTFFMDGGTQSWADSKESVIACIDAAAQECRSLDPDFLLLQEVDFGSTRSYHVDQRQQLTEAFPEFDSVFAVNYHSAFLMYPFTQPHGASKSGILTLSRADITSSERRSLPISTGFSKFLDLDRCYSISRIPVEGGKELVLINIHCSAYGGSDEIRTAQMTQLFADMESEIQAGNYCICGGDFNHDFTGDSGQVLNGSDQQFGWAMPFPTDLIPENISQCLDYNDDTLIATCRNCDVPYGPDCMVFVVDGFLVSDNIEVTELHNIDTGFSYSDHCPVQIRFRLK